MHLSTRRKLPTVLANMYCCFYLRVSTHYFATYLLCDIRCHCRSCCLATHDLMMNKNTTRMRTFGHVHKAPAVTENHSRYQSTTPLTPDLFAVACVLVDRAVPPFVPTAAAAAPQGPPCRWCSKLMCPAGLAACSTTRGSHDLPSHLHLVLVTIQPTERPAIVLRVADGVQPPKQRVGLRGRPCRRGSAL